MDLPDLEESVRMARVAVNGGTSCIVATPHFNIPGEWEDPERILSTYRILTGRAVQAGDSSASFVSAWRSLARRTRRSG